jgi:hypothetical protein
MSGRLSNVEVNELVRYRSPQFARSPLARPNTNVANLTPRSDKFSLGAPLLDAPTPANPLSSNAATFLNLINNYVGMVLLSMHYCFAESGWLALAALALLTGFGAFTGDCLVECYKLIQADNPARAPSYAEIGSRCLGPFGKWLVVASSLLENFFALLCMLIIM